MTKINMKRGLGLLAVATLVTAGLMTAAMADRKADRGEDRAGGLMLLQQFDKIDADKDGLLTEAEILAFRESRFAAADTDGNGSLSAEELSAMQMVQMQERAGMRATRMMERLDADGNGQLSAEEMAKMGAGRSDRGKGMFQRADTDGDGMLSKAEAEAALKRMAERGGKHGKGG